MTKRIVIEAADGYYVETWDYSYDPPRVRANEGPFGCVTELPPHDGWAEDQPDV